MLLTEILNENLIKVPLTARTRDEAIAEMADLVQRRAGSPGTRPCRVNDRDELIRRIKHREDIQSTGVGGGLALMHALMDNTDNRVYTAMGIARPGIEFNALDNKPVDILFLLVCQNGLDVIYLQTLSTIARLFRDKQLCASVRAAADAGDLIDRLRSFEPGMTDDCDHP